MPVSVEARGVQVSDRLSDLIITAAHLPVDLDDVEFEAFVARTMGVPPTSIVRTSDLAEAQRMLDIRMWGWDGQLGSLAEHCVEAIALGHFNPDGNPE